MVKITEALGWKWWKSVVNNAFGCCSTYVENWTADIKSFFYPNLIHVTDLPRSSYIIFNSIAEVRKMYYPDVNKLVSNIKKVFIKAPHHVQVHLYKYYLIFYIYFKI